MNIRQDKKKKTFEKIVDKVTYTKGLSHKCLFV